MTRLPTTRLTAALLTAITALVPVLAGEAAAQPAAPAPAPAPAAAAAPAVAPAPVDPARRTRAKAHADAGIAAHDRGEYDAAIAHYQAAYDELPHPALFFNMAQSHRLAGRPEQALALYRRYLGEVATGSLADQARSWVAALERQLAPGAPGPTAPSTAPGSVVVTPPPATAAAARDDRRGLRLGAYGAGAAGLVALGVGSLYGLRARSISDELSEPNAEFDPAKFDDGQSAETSMFVWYGVSGALLAGGVVLYVLSRPGDEHPTTTAHWAPMVGPDGGGMSWSTAF